MKGLRVQRLKPDRGATKHTSGTSVLIAHSRTPKLRPRHNVEVYKVQILTDRLDVLEGRVETARGVVAEVRAAAVHHLAEHPGEPKLDTSLAERELSTVTGAAEEVRAALARAQRTLAARQASEPTDKELIELEDELGTKLENYNSLARDLIEAQARLEEVRNRALGVLGSTHAVSNWSLVRLSSVRDDLGKWLAAPMIAPESWLV